MVQSIKEVPELLMYWDFERNKLDIELTKATSVQYAHWLCSHCSYSWEARINDVFKTCRRRKQFCPCCKMGKVFKKDKNSILAMFPDLIRYLDFHHEDIDTIKEKLSKEKFNSKRVFQFKCPTCQVIWRGAAMNPKLLHSEEGELFHIDCNEWSYHYFYHEVYPNLTKIYHDELNQKEFKDLKLNENVTLHHHWKCDTCQHEFELSIDRLFARIRRTGYYCTECHASFNKPITEQMMNPPLSFLHSQHLNEWSAENEIAESQVDTLSNIDVRWNCTNCEGTYSCKVLDKDNHSCPYCQDQKMLRGFNTLEKTHRFLKDFWNAKNTRNLDDYWHKSNDLVSWVCPCCGIEFDCSPKEMILRTELGNWNFQTCPNFCEWVTSIFKNNAFHNEPILVEEWSEKNKMPIFLAQTDIETKKYWWCCSNCHGEYLCSIPRRREVKNSCPYCSNKEPLKGLNTLLDLYPDLNSMWNVENNVSTEEIVIDTKSNKRYLWHCNTCYCNFREKLNVVLERYLKSNPPSTDNVCPNCTDQIIPAVQNNLKETHPHLMSEWDYLNNILLANPERVTGKSLIRVWWKCQNNPNHRYKKLIRERVLFEKRNMEPCIICKGRRRKREHFVPFK